MDKEFFSKKVSIIMPTYKGANLIEKSIKSILNQTYENIELIIVDDNGLGTKEQLDTEKIVNKFWDNKKVIYLTHNVNKNGSAARNTGIKKATGEYIAFLDDDDCFYEQKIQKQVEKFEVLPESYGIIYGGVNEIYPTGRVKVILPQEVDDFLYEYLKGTLFVCSSSIMIKKEVIEVIGLWDESFQRHQDMEYIVRIASKYKVAFINEPLIRKERVDRNLPQDAKKVEKYRKHYLKKMKKYIELYNEQLQKEIYFCNYLVIGKAYLKNKKIGKAIYYAIISKKPISMFAKYLFDAMEFLKRR